ncbi:MAG: twin-arginine translocase subunit TatC [Saprospiraceae bacterium]|nr:twin-arginine translocase subunit TatC [Saprospiraceae bacterium]MBP7699448.1 twin-arginine translocase subunit TatC [Saprospiraceae bacterium]
MPLDQVDVDEIEKPKHRTDEMSFFDHIDELRSHLIRAVIGIAVGGIVMFMSKDFIFDKIIFAPRHADFPTFRALCTLSRWLHTDALCFTPQNFQIITRELGEQFSVHLQVSIMLGLILAFPYVFWEIWRFVKPGLHPKEQAVTRNVVLVCSVLFFLGILFGYYIVAPFCITFLVGYEIIGAEAAPTLASYVNYMTMFTLPLGIVFELPILIYFLTKLGLVSSAFLREYRRHAIVIILIVAGVITPPDVVSQSLVTLPLLLLFEISILVARNVEKKARLAEAAETATYLPVKSE